MMWEGRNVQVAHKAEGGEAGCSSVWGCTGSSENSARPAGLLGVDNILCHAAVRVVVDVLALAADQGALDTAVVLNRMLRLREVVVGKFSRP